MSSGVETSLISIAKDLIRSLPVRSTSGLPVYVASSPAAPFSTSLRFARNDNDCKRTHEWLAVRLSAHDRMKIGRVIGAAHQRSGGDVPKPFATGDVAVIVELLRPDVFNHGQMFSAWPQILAHRQHFAADLAQVVHRLEKFCFLFAQTKH